MEAQELKQELEAIRDGLDQRFEGRIKALDDAITELSQRSSGMPGGLGSRQKGIGEQFTESAAFKALQSGEQKSARFECKNTVSNLIGSPGEVGDVIAQPDRLPGAVLGARRPLDLLDVLPTGSTSSSIVEYTMEESWTNAAAETQEAATKPESTWEPELQQETVRTIAHFLKMSNQAMADSPQVVSAINGRLTHGARQRLQRQILRGDGSSPNLTGLDQSGRHADFTPQTGETALQSINRAKYDSVGADFLPDLVILNPADWGAIERDTSDADGKYIAGENAAISYVANGLIPTAWGMPVVMSNDVASGKFFCLARAAVTVFLRQGVTVEMGYVGNDFVQNLTTIRCELRAALAVFNPPAVRYGDLTV